MNNNNNNTNNNSNTTSNPSVRFSNNRGSGGRGNQGGRSSGNRGQGRQSNRSNNSNSNRGNSNRRATKEKGATEEIKDYVFDCSSRKDIKACNETLEKIAVYVGKEYKNGELFKHIIEHLEDPKIKAPERLTTEQENDEFEKYKWKKLMDKYIDKLDLLETGKHKLFSLIWGQCTGLMQTELMACENYKDFKEAGDPIALIKAIKGITYNFRDQKYLPGSLWKAYKNLFNTVQRDDEDLKKFYDRFKNAVEVIENYGGDISSMTTLWENDEKYIEMKEDDDKQDYEDLRSELFDEFAEDKMNNDEKAVLNTVKNKFQDWIDLKEQGTEEVQEAKEKAKEINKEKLFRLWNFSEL